MTAREVTDLDHYRARFLQHLLSEATAAYWERRALTFDAAAPRPGDYTGRATPAQLDAARARCQGAAEACRNHAHLIRQDGLHGAARIAWQALAELHRPTRTAR